MVGCTSLQLKRSTLAQGKTLTELQYEMVLDNLAMFRQAPDALPWHLKIAQGSIAINDSLNPSFSYNWPVISHTLSLSGTRSWQDSWTVTPLVNNKFLKQLQNIYNNSCRAEWIHEGFGPPDSFGGHFRQTYIWVGRENVKDLTDITLKVLHTQVDADKEASPQLGPALLPGPVPRAGP
jgi:hypothetical protein